MDNKEQIIELYKEFKGSGKKYTNSPAKDLKDLEVQALKSTIEYIAKNYVEVIESRENIVNTQPKKSIFSYKALLTGLFIYFIVSHYESIDLILMAFAAFLVDFN